MNGKDRINEMYAFVVVDDDGTEGIPALRSVNGVAMPLVGADLDRIADLRPFAQDLAQRLGKPIDLIRFTVREHLETIQ